MEIISFLNFRGGCGKSSNLQNIASILAKVYKKRVLVVDLDPQMNTTFTFRGSDQVPSILDVLTKETVPAASLQVTDYGALIASSDELFAGEQLIQGEEREYRLKDALDQIADHFDYCLIDTSPGLNILTINAMVASDRAIIPLLPEGYSMQGMRKLIEVIEQVQNGWNPDLKVAGLLLNRVERGKLVDEAKKWARNTATQLNTRLFDTAIRKSIKVSEAQINQSTLIDYAPKNNATQDYLSLVEEIIEED